MKKTYSAEEIIRNYEKQAEEILYQMIKLLEKEQKKIENEKYKKIINEIETHDY